MWYEIYKFEIAYRLKRPETYLFFVFIFIFSLAGVDFVFQGVELGEVRLNAPLVIAKTMAAISGILMLITSLIMGVPVLRDSQYEFETILYSYPMRKSDFLLGRFLGSFTILLIVFLGLVLGLIFGEFLPWRHQDDLLPFNLISYLHTFAFIVLPILFAGAALFFVSGALSQNRMVVYTQGIFFFALFMLVQAINNPAIQALVDPLSLTTLTDISKHWSTIDRNQRLIPIKDAILHNKSLWLAIGGLSLIIGYHLFHFDLGGRRAKRKRKVLLHKVLHSTEIITIPTFNTQDSFYSHVHRILLLAKFYFFSICKQASFWSIIICALIIIMVNSINLGTIYGVDSYPRTYLIIEELQEMSIYFFFIVLIFYSGEIIWKERDVNLDLITDSTIIPSFSLLLGKFIGLSWIYMIILVALILFGLLFQTVSGYFIYDLKVYFSGMFLELFPFLLLYTFIAFFIQILTNRKFVGFILVLGFFVANILHQGLGYDHNLYTFAGKALGLYSEMNGYAQALYPYFLVKIYWIIFGFLLLIGASILIARGREQSLSKRWSLGKGGMTQKFKKATILLLLIFCGLGGFIFYNTNVLNEYWTSQKKDSYRLNYEKTLKQFEYKEQPIITAVNLQVELFPKKKQYVVKGQYGSTNPHKTPIEEIHVQKLLDAHLNLEAVHFSREASLDDQYSAFGYSIYQLEEALLPGDSIKMNFRQIYNTDGFEENSSTSGFFENGTFLTNKELPSFGYNRKYEFKEERKRLEANLPRRAALAKLSNAKEAALARNGSDAHLVNFEVVIGTDEDQTAIAPGELVSKWKKNNRNYFHFRMAKPIINFFSIHSGRFEVKQEKYQLDSAHLPIDLEIYHHQGHDYNLDRMMEAMKMSLQYHNAHLSPYLYDQLRIVEFPRYESFAQSLPTTIPFSESMGFLLDINDETDVDMAFFITAHETAHQWWGMQLEAANVEGRNMILETLAQYTALMVMKQKYPLEKIHQFLKMEMENYLKKRNKDSHKEVPLSLVANQDYIYYEKGAINMFAFQEYLGENKVNRALRKFIKNWNSYDGNKKCQVNRFANTEDLLDCFKEVTPDSLQFLITDLFETITIYDNKIRAANISELGNGKFEVMLDIDFNKYQNFEEKSPSKEESIDVAVYGADGAILYLEKHGMFEPIKVRVEEQPSKVILDPFFKLIDQNIEDNVMALN